MKKYFFYLIALLLPLQAAICQQDLKPLQADVDNLKQQVSRLTADLAADKPVKNPPKPLSKEAQDRQILQRRELEKQLQEKQQLLDQKQKQLNELTRMQRKEPAPPVSKKKTSE